MTEKLSFYKVSIRLDEVTVLEPNDQGYVRVNTDTLVDLTLTAGTEDEALLQASKHVLVMQGAYAPAKADAR